MVLNRNQKHNQIIEIHDYGILLESREIFLHSSFDSEEDSGVEFRNANIFLKNIRMLEQSGNDSIVIHQHSVGGEWPEGMMMYDAIANCKCHVIFIMHGQACSMGSIIPQAADTRVITKHCDFMAHDGGTGINSSLTYKQAQTMGKYEATVRVEMMDIYARVCSEGTFFKDKSEKQIKAYINRMFEKKEDWYLTAEDAVNYGFADGVLGVSPYENVEEIRQNINGK